MYGLSEEGLQLTRDRLAGLGLEMLASLVIEQASKDPGLLERLRRLIAGGAKRDEGDRPEWPMIGASPAMQELRRTLRKVAAADAPVLITGESGTGKELAAVAIHRRSSRADGPFIPINCAALPETLIASELFGHEKGAFTGAEQRRIGRIQAADKGTLFLDEIGDLPLDMQAHLLRFLQEGTIDRVGAVHPIKVDVRVVAATNVGLRQAVAEGRFRQDLFFRLNVLTVETPPLRRRGEDVDHLARHFVDQFAAEAGRSFLGLSPQAQRLVTSYPWPGNVRELIACMRRAVVMADGPWIEPADLDLPAAEALRMDGASPVSLRAARRDAEEAMIRQALMDNNNNIKRTAEHLGISRVTLYRLVDKYGILNGT